MFEKGNKLSTGRPKGSVNKSTLLKNFLISLLYEKQSELKAMNAKELLKPIASLLPKESKIDLNSGDINITINKTTDCDKPSS